MNPAAFAAATAVSLVPQFGHNSNVTSVDITADGRLAASASYDNSARIWDAESGRLLRVLSAEGDQNIVIARFVDQGSKVVTVSQNGYARHWSTDTGEMLRMFIVDPVLQAAISADGRRLVIAPSKGAGSLWDLATGKRLARMKGKGSFSAAGISDDGGTVALGEQSGRIRLFDGRGRPLKHWQAHESPEVHPLAAKAGVKKQPPFMSKLDFSPDGKRLISLALQDLEQSARIWDLDGRLVAPVKAKAIAPRHASFARDGRHVLLGAFQNLSILDAQSLKLVGETTKSANVALDAQTSEAGGRVVIGDATTGASMLIWDRHDADTVRVLGTKGSLFERVRFSADGRRLHTVDRARTEVKQWDLTTLQPIRTLRFTSHGSFSAAMSRDERLVYVPAVQAIERVDAQTGAPLPSLPMEGHSIYKTEISDDGETLLLGYVHGHVELRSAKTGKLIRRLTGDAPDDNFGSAVNDVRLSPDGRRVLACGGLRGSFRVWDRKSGKLIRRVRAYSGKHENILSCRFSPDGRRILTNGQRAKQGQPTVKLWSVGGKLIGEFVTGHFTGNAAVWMPDGRRFLAAYYATVTLYDADSGKALRTFSGHNSSLADIAVSPDGQYLATAAWGGKLILWRIADGAHVTLLTTGDDWVAYADDGVFDASREGGRLVGMVQGRRAFSIDQFALRNNRPDLLLERMGLGAAGLRDHYMRRWKRRIRKAAISEADAKPGVGTLEVPTASLQARGVAGRRARLDAQCSDAKWPIVGRSLFVDGVPAAALNGADGGLEVEVTPGRNLIELSCVNAVGGESFRDQAVVRVQEEDVGDLWFLGFGVSKYRDSSLNLQFAHQDALDLAGVLAAKAGVAGGPYRRAHVRTFVDAQATRQAVASASEHIAKARPEDTLVLFVAGHGLHDGSAEAEYYYLTHEADPNDLPRTAAPFALFEDLLTRATPRRKLFLLDTCESGEADPEAEGVRVAALTGTRGIRARSTRGVSLGALAASGSKSKAPPASEAWRAGLVRRNRFIYNDLARRSGAVVFSSSRGGELSYESPKWANGLFTEELVRALTTPVADADRNRQVTARELRRYVSEAVGRLSKGAQNPVVDRDNIHQHIAFPIGTGKSRVGIH